MGPTRVDPLIHARSIVFQCIERDFWKSTVGERAAPSERFRDAGWHRDGSHGPSSEVDTAPCVTNPFSGAFESRRPRSYVMLLLALAACVVIGSRFFWMH